MRRLALLALLLAGRAQAVPGDVERGKGLYAVHCAQCHGDTGEGDGPSAPFLYPRPRVLAGFAVYKYRSTPTGELPTDDDVFAAISRGFPGTGMPAFDALSEQERWDLVAAVKAMSEDFSTPSLVQGAVAMRGLDAPAPPATAESVERGRVLYQDNECFKCHGAQGRGDGPSWTTLTDDWGDPVLPSNLANPDTFRAGDSPEAVYRILSTGLDGSSMPSYDASLSVEERWDLAHYVLSLGPPPGARRSTTVHAHRVAAVPAGPEDPLWASAPVARFRTLPNLMESPRRYWPAVEFVMVQALYDEGALALRVQWDDRTRSTGTDLESPYPDRDGTLYRDTPHPDQLAVQVPVLQDDSMRPQLLFGDGRRAVELWWWGGDRDAAVTRLGRGSDRIRDAEGALYTESLHADGRYTLYLRRPLSSEGGAALEPGRFVPLAVHVWDGSRGEVGTRHALTSWQWLFLEADVPRRAYVAPGVAFGITWLLLVAWAAWLRRREEEPLAPPGTRLVPDPRDPNV